MSVLWNLASAATAFATNFESLLWPRIMFGVFSSALDPIALRLCAKYFPTWRRAFATGLFMACLYIGAAISSISLIVSQRVGWRTTYVLVAILGVFLTLVVGPFIKSGKTTPEQHTHRSLPLTKQVWSTP
jgi:MFS family permease